MAKRKKHHRSRKTGLPPGSLVYVGDQPESQPLIQRISYGQDGVKKEELEGVQSLSESKPGEEVQWINIIGLHHPETIQTIGDRYRIHPLILEDIINTEQRPKMEASEGHLFLTLKMLTDWPDHSPELSMEQVSFILGPGYLLSFQEQEGDLFDPIRLRLEKPASRFRSQGADYLLYALLDVVVDRYLVMLERMSTELDEIEDQIIGGHERQALHDLQQRKRQLTLMRRVALPLREAVLGLSRDDTPLIAPFTHRYLSDVHDHLVQIQEIIDTLRELCVELRETQLALLSNRTNEVMKLLTIIATIFIPLTFVAGVYGMNFRYMPELEWKYGYLLVWILMAGMTLLMIRYFHRKGWL